MCGTEEQGGTDIEMDGVGRCLHTEPWSGTSYTSFLVHVIRVYFYYCKTGWKVNFLVGWWVKMTSLYVRKWINIFGYLRYGPHTNKKINLHMAFMVCAKNVFFLYVILTYEFCFCWWLYYQLHRVLKLLGYSTFFLAQVFFLPFCICWIYKVHSPYKNLVVMNCSKNSTLIALQLCWINLLHVPQSSSKPTIMMTISEAFAIGKSSQFVLSEYENLI